MRVVVAGAGLAGLTFATAARTHDVVVLDERPALGGGAGLTMWPLVLRHLDAVSVDDPRGGRSTTLGALVRDIGAPAPAAGVRRPDGRPVHRLDSDRVTRALGEAPRVVRRDDLQRLLEATAAPAQVLTGRGVEAVDLTAPRPAVHLTDGSTEAGDVVVGADGFRSVVARAVDPTVGQRYAGYTAVRQVAEVEVDPRWHGVVWGDRCEAGLAPLPDGRTYWFATAAVPEEDAETEATAETITRRLRTWAGPWAEVLDASGPVTPLALHDRDQPRRWSSGAVGVIGDAAHPMQPTLGSGGAHAMVDAVRLAALLATHPPAEAWARLERERRGPVTRTARRARLVGRALHGTRPSDRLARRAAELVPDAVVLAGLRSSVGAGRAGAGRAGAGPAGRA